MSAAGSRRPDWEGRCATGRLPAAGCAARATDRGRDAKAQHRRQAHPVCLEPDAMSLVLEPGTADAAGQRVRLVGENAPVAHLRRLRDGRDPIGFDPQLWDASASSASRRRSSQRRTTVGRRRRGRRDRRGARQHACAVALPPPPCCRRARSPSPGRRRSRRSGCRASPPPTPCSRWRSTRCRGTTRSTSRRRPRPEDGASSSGAKTFVVDGHVAARLIVVARVDGGGPGSSSSIRARPASPSSAR